MENRIRNIYVVQMGKQCQNYFLKMDLFFSIMNCIFIYNVGTQCRAISTLLYLGIVSFNIIVYFI